MAANKQIVLFEPFAEQRDFINAVLSKKYNFIMYGGAIRSGKTFCGLGTLIILCGVYPGSRWVLVRKDLQTIKRNTFPSWDKIKPGPAIKSHNHDTQTVTFKNGSQIIFFGENYASDKDLNRWRGLECNGFLLEEINELQQASFFKSFERAGSYIIPGLKEQPPPLVLATCNPSFGWVKDDIYNLYKNGTMPDKWLYIPARIDDNPFIPQSYKDNLKYLPRYEYEVFVMGNWDIKLKTGGEFLKEFDLDKHIRPINFDPAAPVHISLDENVNPYLTLTIWQIEDNKIKQIGEILGRSPNNTVIKVSQKLLSWLARYKFNDMVFIYGDRTSLKQDTKLEKGQNFFTIFQNEINKQYNTRLRLPSVNPSVALSGNFINAILEVNYMDLEIIIDEQLKESINDYTDTKEAADGGILKQKIKDKTTGVIYEINGHITDTMRYFICEAFKREFSQFQNRLSPGRVITSKNYKRN